MAQKFPYQSGVISKDSKMSVIVLLYLVPSLGAFYMVEMHVCPAYLTIWEVRIGQGTGESVVLIEGS